MPSPPAQQVGRPIGNRGDDAADRRCRPEHRRPRDRPAASARAGWRDSGGAVLVAARDPDEGEADPDPDQLPDPAHDGGVDAERGWKAENPIDEIEPALPRPQLERDEDHENDRELREGADDERRRVADVETLSPR